MHEIKNGFEEARKLLDNFISADENFERIALAGNLMVKSLSEGGKIISCGNGGSMCDAMHFAEELTGRYRNDRPPIAAISVSDQSFITCTANDYGFEYIFSRFIEGTGNSGDVLMAISTSGNSENILLAAACGKEKGNEDRRTYRRRRW
jgi:D-sedoheptulose 7-phosphate isomerase